ncbi:MAG: citrate synthase [Corynebacterium sp.]|nr:citrate synthase [Corynebacterium sp.]
MAKALETDGKAKLIYPGGEYEMDIIKSTSGNQGIDIRKLRSTTGLVTFDPGYQATGSTASEITYIDGEAGQLAYRGYDIADLAEHATFNEVSFLLIYGHLPTRAELDEFNNTIRHHTLIDEDFKRHFSIFPRHGNPMSTLAASVNILSTYYDSVDDVVSDPDVMDRATIRLLAKVPMLAAYVLRARDGDPYMYPDNSLHARANFMRMMFGFPTEPYEVDELKVKALDQIFILHADHEQNCSTSTVRQVASAGANMFVSIAAGINALSGPLHGGANVAALAMLRRIQKEFDGDAKKFMELVKAKADGVRLMGFGHRVYKSYDPRASFLKKTAHEIIEKFGSDETLDLAMQLEEIALNDDYFVSRNLYPNVDYYSGIIYTALGFPEDFFTVLFAIGRLPGWIAQYREQVTNPEGKIFRPRQIYVGDMGLKVPPRDQR